MKKYTESVFIMMLLVFTGCQKVVDANNLLDTAEKVSIIGFLSPSDTVLRINVTRALPLIGTPLPTDDIKALDSKFLIEDAVVVLSDEVGNRAILGYSKDDRSYLGDPTTLPIITGNIYYLTVSVEGKEFSASCKIPNKVTEINHQVIYRNDEFGNRLAEISLGFTDLKDEDNFYMLGGSYNSTYSFENEEPQTIEGLLFFDVDRFLTDNSNDGGTLGGKTEIYIGQGTEVISNSVVLQVAHVEEILFQQMRALDLNTEAADGNPFVEYSISPNNILDKGAVGIFAGYQVKEKEVVLEIEENP